jgi:hypothetical protein
VGVFQFAWSDVVETCLKLTVAKPVGLFGGCVFDVDDDSIEAFVEDSGAHAFGFCRLRSICNHRTSMAGAAMARVVHTAMAGHYSSIMG